MLNFDDYKNTKPYKAINSKERKEWYEEESRLHEKFKTDLYKDLGIEDSPKRDMLFALAWDHGHADGLHNVYYHASEMAPLIK
ncbi:MAG TPA: hypothetical protein PLA71_00510 [Saccharofermentans sp.]|nr:hypothetical protein [Saccharofermentans sp.]